MEGLGQPPNPDERGLDGLLQKGCAMALAVNAETDGIFYGLTPFGFTLARAVESLLKRVTPEEKANVSTPPTELP